jgi:hypothetical protein
MDDDDVKSLAKYDSTLARADASGRETTIAIVTGSIGTVVGVFIAVVAGWAAVSAALGLLANLVMAVAAIAAFSLWRVQIHGQSRHAAAVEALRVAHQIEIAARRFVDAAISIKARYAQDEETQASFSNKELRVRRDQLHEAMDSVTPAIITMRTHWGPRTAKPLEKMWDVAVDTLVSIENIGHELEYGDSGEGPMDQAKHGEWNWYWLVDGRKADRDLYVAHLQKHLAAVDEWAAPYVGRARAPDDE